VKEAAAVKLERMESILRELKRVVVAFSGGVDSTFVLKAACEALGVENVLAVTGRSDSVPVAALAEASDLARSMGVRHLVIDTREFDDPRYRANPENRCYFCKTELYTRLGAIAAEHGLLAAVNGVNADDLGDFRPGLKAASEHGVRAPAAEAGLTKAEIRELSRRMGLPTHDKPASPCLSSRVQYGEEITPDKLRMIERAEQSLHEMGFRECRVRHHHNLARIEVPPERVDDLLQRDIRARIDAAFRDIGYTYVTLDLRGFRSGSMNEVIAFGRAQPLS
jgi:uncharacterized protein